MLIEQSKSQEDISIITFIYNAKHGAAGRGRQTWPGSAHKVLGSAGGPPFFNWVAHHEPSLYYSYLTNSL